MTSPKPKWKGGGRVVDLWQRGWFSQFSVARNRALWASTFVWCCAVCICCVVYRHCGSMLEALRRAAMKTLDRHLAAWCFPPYWSTGCFCQRITIGVESLGVAQAGSFGWWLNWGLEMEVMGKTMWMKMTPETSFDKVGSLEEMGKRKKRSQMTDGGCLLQRISGRTFVCVKDAASPQGLESLRMVCGPSKPNPNRQNLVS